VFPVNHRFDVPDRLNETTAKLQHITKAADEAERQVKLLSNSSENDGDRVANLEKQLKAAKVCRCGSTLPSTV
jgi:hypothetical protein